MTRPIVLGVLMLETRFPRLVGDIGNPVGWPYDMRYRVVRGASPKRVVRGGDPALLQPFIEAGQALVDDGAEAITTSCGFLVMFQQALQAALPVPVWTSSLLLLPELQARGAVGVVTVDATALGAAHLHAAGAAPDTPVEGLAPGCAFQRCLLDGGPDFDVDAARAETVAAAEALLRRRPDVGTIVLECTNLPPYADTVRAATGRDVQHLGTLLGARRLTRLAAAVSGPDRGFHR